MLNQVTLVGEVVAVPILRETQSGYKMATMQIMVDRNYKSVSGEVEKDLFEVTLWRAMAEECIENCKLNSMVGISARLQSNNFTKDEKTYYKSNIIAERISVLS
jgi:single-stranded DNA-binding protein